MKNLIKKIAFIFFLFLGFQAANAQSLTQNQDRPEVIAKAQVNELVEKLDLTGDQQRSLFRTYVAKVSNYQKHIEGKDLNNAAVKANKKKFDAGFTQNVKKILTDEQYKKWLSLQK